MSIGCWSTDWSIYRLVLSEISYSGCIVSYSRWWVDSCGLRTLFIDEIWWGFGLMWSWGLGEDLTRCDTGTWWELRKMPVAHYESRIRWRMWGKYEWPLSCDLGSCLLRYVCWGSRCWVFFDTWLCIDSINVLPHLPQYGLTRGSGGGFDRVIIPCLCKKIDLIYLCHCTLSSDYLNTFFIIFWHTREQLE